MVPIAAPNATANTKNMTSTTKSTPKGILPHNFLLYHRGLVSTGSSFSLKLCSVVSNDAEEDSVGSAGIWFALEYEDVTGAVFPVCVSGLCGGRRAGVTASNNGTEGKEGAKKVVALRGDTGDAGVMKGSSGSTGLGAGMMRDALASAASEALVGPSSGYLEYGGSCSVCPSGPMISCSSPSGPSTLWYPFPCPGKPRGMFVWMGGSGGCAGSVGNGSSMSSSIPLCEYMAYGCVGRCSDIDLCGCRSVEAVATLDVRAMVCCGYMPYGWLGPVSKGLSPFEVVANDPVLLTDMRCAKGDGELGPRLCIACGRLSCAVESRTFAVLFRVAVLRRSLSGGGFDVDVCRCIVSFASWFGLSPWCPSFALAFAGRKPSETEGIKSSSSGSISKSSSKTSGLSDCRRWGSLSLLRRSMTPTLSLRALEALSSFQAS
jgi:hypothetical protein